MKKPDTAPIRSQHLLCVCNGIGILITADEHAVWRCFFKNRARMPGSAERSVCVGPSRSAVEIIEHLLRHDRYMGIRHGVRVLIARFRF